MAGTPKLELNLAVVDADKVINEMRELRNESRRALLFAITFWFISGVFVGIFLGVYR